MKFRRGVWIAVAVAVVATLTGYEVRASAPASDGCVTASAHDAALALFGDQARLAPGGTDAIVTRGPHGEPELLRSGVVRTRELLPFVRHRMVGSADGRWCDAAAGFGALTDGLSARSAAELLLSTAAAPFFDEITIRDLSTTETGFEAETHAETNGIVARWDITVDETGRIAAATWEAVDHRVEPMTWDWEGLTAKPGASIAYRVVDGALLTIDDPVATTRAEMERLAADPAAVSTSAPVKHSVIEMSDGFVVEVSRGTPYAYSTEQTGIWDVDIMATIAESTRSTYESFLDWGLTDATWTGPGHVFLDGGLSAVCYACVYPLPVFNVHISRSVIGFLKDLDYEISDPHEYLTLIMGHEIFHNFQVAYLGGTGGYVDWSYIEGLARFQQTLHPESHADHHEHSLIFHDNSFDGTCNGYPLVGVDRGLSERLYSACYAWMHLYDMAGPAMIPAMFDASVEADRIARSLWYEEAHDMAYLIEAVTGSPAIDFIADFAIRSMTPREMSWGPLLGGGPTLDWGEHLDTWTPHVNPVSRLSVYGGGVDGIVVDTDLHVDLSSVEPGDARLLTVDVAADGSRTVNAVTPQHPLTVISAPDPGIERTLILVSGLSYAVAVFAEIDDGSGGGEGPLDAELNLYESWTYEDTDENLPSQTAEASTELTVSNDSVSYSLLNHASDDLPGTYVYPASAWTFNHSYWNSQEVPADDYTVTLTVDVTRHDLDWGRNYPLDDSYAYADVVVWFECLSCWDWDSWDSAWISDEGEHQIELTIPLFAADGLGLEVDGWAGTYADGGYADAALDVTVRDITLARAN